MFLFFISVLFPIDVIVLKLLLGMVVGERHRCSNYLCDVQE